MEESLGWRHTEQGAYLAAATRLAEDGHVAGISAKLTDILLNPLQGLHDVEHTHIAGTPVFLAASREVEEAEDVQTVVDAHHDHVSLRQFHPWIPGRCARVEATAVQPDHHGLRAFGVRCPDIQHARVLFRHLGFTQLLAPRLLHRLRPPVVAHPDGVPLVNRQWRHKPLHLRIRNTQEAHRSLVVEALHQSRLSPHHHLLVFISTCGLCPYNRQHRQHQHYYVPFHTSIVLLQSYHFFSNPPNESPTLQQKINNAIHFTRPRLARPRPETS